MEAVVIWPPSELRIRGSDSQIALLRERLEQAQALQDGWNRDLETESRLKKRWYRPRDLFCFAGSATDQRPAATILLEPKWPDGLGVPDVIPNVQQRFTEEEYNRVLADFASQVLQPAIVGTDVEIEVAPKRLDLNQYLSPEAMRRLEVFSASADRNSPHPEDSPDWQKFLIRVHLDEPVLYPEHLGHWLAEQGWPEPQCERLVDVYLLTRSFLSAYDEERSARCRP
jgi:hypothetical protein